MNNVYRLFVVCALALISSSASANRDVSGITICAVQAQETSAVVYPCEWYTSRATTRNANGWIVFPLSTPGGKLMYATAMEAMLNYSQVMIRIDLSNSSAYYDTAIAIRVYR